MLAHRAEFIISTALLGVVLSAAPGWAADAGTVSVIIKQPVSSPTTLVGPVLAISVVVQSTYDLKGVHGQVDTVGVDLSPPSSQGMPWTGAVNIDALPRGAKTLVVTATDLLSETGTANASFFHDDPPVITITSPTDPSVARPTVHVVATCTDDDTAVGCLSFMAAVGSVSASGGSSIDATLDLNLFEGSESALTFSAKDSNGQPALLAQKIFIDSSFDLVSMASTKGEVLDFDSARVLYRNVGKNVIVLQKLIDSSEVQLGAVAPYGNEFAPQGGLTSAGAWFSTSAGHCVQAYEWRGATTAKFHEDCVDIGRFQVNGDYAFWGYTDINDPFVTIRNLAAGTDARIRQQYANDAGVFGSVWFGLGPRGQVVSLGQDPSTNPLSCPVALSQGGSAFAEFTSVPYCDACDPSIVTDGVNTILNQEVVGPQGCQTTLVDQTGTRTPLSEVRVTSPPANAYAAAGGWTAFLKKSASGIQQVWVRSPSGTETQLSPFGTDSSIEAVDSVGEAIFQNGGRRYFASPTSTPVAISGALGRAVWRLVRNHGQHRLSSFRSRYGCRDGMRSTIAGRRHPGRIFSKSGCWRRRNT